MNNRRKMFVSEYLKDFNAARAARDSGYSEKTARTIGQKLLTFVDVKQAIEERMMSKSEVILGLTDIARGDIADLMEITTSGFTLELLVADGNGNKVRNPKTKLIKKIKQKTTTYLAKSESEEDREVIETEIELYSAHEAFKDLGRVHGLFVDRSENLNLDVSTLTDDQIDRLLKGESLPNVIKRS